MKSKLTKHSLRYVTLASLISIVCGQAANAAPQRTILALSKGDHTCAIVDPETLKVLARLPVGPDPHEVVASTDGKRAYVSNTGSGRFHEVNILDLSTQKALPNLDTEALLGPHGLAFSGGKLWFTAEGAKSVGRFDPTSAKIDWIMGTGQNRTHMVYVTSDQKQIYTTNVDSGTVSIFDYVEVPPTMPPTGVLPANAHSHMVWLQTVITADKGCEGFDVSPDGKTLWTAAAQKGTITVIDIAKKEAVSTFDANVAGANRLKFSPDGKYALVSSLKSGDLTIFDVATQKEIKRLNIGHGAAGILIDPEKSRAFISCTADDYVSVVDLKTLEVSGKIDVGGKPDGLAWAVNQ